MEVTISAHTSTGKTIELIVQDHKEKTVKLYWREIHPTTSSKLNEIGIVERSEIQRLGKSV